MRVPYKRILINLPEELLADVDQAAALERRKRNEFVREAIRDRIRKIELQSALSNLRSKVVSDRSEDEIAVDVEAALEEARADKKQKRAAAPKR